MIYREDIVHAARPLRRIFWGALLVLFDVTVTTLSNGEGFRFDILDDTVGMALITAAVARLRDIHVDSSHAGRMRFIHWVSILVVIQSVIDHFLFPRPWLLTFLWDGLGLAKIVALLLFCACMRDLCREAMLAEAARRWHTTLALFVVSVGLLLIVGFAGKLSGGSFHVVLAPGMLLGGALFLVPIVSFFRATSTMARAAEMPAFPLGAAELPRVTALRRD